MKTNWKDIWEKKGQTIKDLSHESLLEISGFDGGQSVLTPEMLRKALHRYEREIGLERGESIYEVGCGCGSFLYHWYKTGYDVGGSDLSGSLISIATQALPKGYWEVSEANKFYINRGFDHITAFSMFFYFPDYDYAKDVLYRMIMKGRRSVSIFDIPDLSKKEHCENVRRSLIPDYDEKYKDITHLYYPKSWWIDTLNGLGLRYKIYDQDIPGYENGKFRYNITIGL